MIQPTSIAMVSDTATLAQMMGVDIERKGRELMCVVSPGAEIILRRALATLSDAAIIQVIRAIASTYPNEACGFLLDDGDALAVPNVAADPRRTYAIAPEMLLAMHRQGRVVVGVFHSHPDGTATPSATDRALAQAGWTHLIVATHGRCITDAQVFVG